jgi:DNA polymerase-1
MKYILIDCSHVCYAAYFSMKNLRAGAIETGVIYGFLKRILKVAQHMGSNRLIFCWDSPRSIRKERYSFYKEKRSKAKDPAMMEMMHEQMELLRNVVLPTIGFNNNIMIDGYEADDIVCQIVAERPKSDFIIVANDEDLYQIFRYRNLKGIWKVKDNALYTPQDFADEHLGLKPRLWAKVKQIAGCGTDEVPGIKGVGEKTAVKYLTGNLADRLKSYKDIISPEGRAIAKRNWWLVRLPLEGTIDQDLRFYKNTFSKKGFIRICKMYHFQSLMSNRWAWYKLMEMK